jgi:glutamate dehydrogenase (NADP+)/cyclic pyranopterin phosphate synthase/molybdopterin-guanine dinucleotide biosynthesis protein A
MSRGRVLGVAGWQGAGKTTLLASAAAALRERGLAVAALAHAHHPIRVDPVESDSDRLYRAGADVVLAGGSETLVRSRLETAEVALEPLAAKLLRTHDLVLVEGWKASPHPKVWLLRPGETAPPAEVSGIERVLPWDGDRLGSFLAWAQARLAAAWTAAECRGGVLVGGRSRRMGRPKAAIEIGGRTLLARAVEALARVGEVTLLGGSGGLADVGVLTRLSDAAGVEGPLAGMLAALRWAPDSTWVIAACDLPLLSRPALDWLLAQRSPGTWAVLPWIDGEAQPLLAVYEPMCLPLLESIAAQGPAAPSRLVGHPRVVTPRPPDEVAPAWRGANTPGELAALLDGSS